MNSKKYYTKLGVLKAATIRKRRESANRPGVVFYHENVRQYVFSVVRNKHLAFD